MKYTLLTAVTLLMTATACMAQPATKTYALSEEDIVNPERGFYIPTGTTASRFVPLDSAQLSGYRMKNIRRGSATYTTQVSLIYRGYELDKFVHTPLSDSFLLQLQNDFNIVRKSGLKIILRFMYTNKANPGNCTDEYKICPPYGDAPRDIVFRHIAQLKPLLQRNADVIAVLQEGFIGIWGENYFTDHFGDASTNSLGVVPDSSWRHRNQLLKLLLDAMPKSRMVQVRTPQIKQKYVHGVQAKVNVAPMIAGLAATNADVARIGFHNDCFLASEDDYGTFYSYGSTAAKRDTANQQLRRYFEADSRYVAVGGETCDDAFSPQNDCPPAGRAIDEMAAMHYSYLNAAYNNHVNNDWDSAGCMKEIKRRLGYRLALTSTTFPSTTIRGRKMVVRIDLQNLGFAAPYNPRPVQVVLLHRATGAVTRLALNTDVRKWYPGNIRLQQSLMLPRSMPAGSYDVYLALPDAAPALAGKAEYAIQLANTDTWDGAKGLNKLAHVLEVR